MKIKVNLGKVNLELKIMGTTNAIDLTTYETGMGLTCWVQLKMLTFSKTVNQDIIFKLRSDFSYVSVKER